MPCSLDDEIGFQSGVLRDPIHCIRQVGHFPLGKPNLSGPIRMADPLFIRDRFGVGGLRLRGIGRPAKWIDFSGLGTRTGPGGSTERASVRAN